MLSACTSRLPWGHHNASFKEYTSVYYLELCTRDLEFLDIYWSIVLEWSIAKLESRFVLFCYVFVEIASNDIILDFCRVFIREV